MIISVEFDYVVVDYQFDLLDQFEVLYYCYYIVQCDEVFDFCFGQLLVDFVEFGFVLFQGCDGLVGL